MIDIRTYRASDFEGVKALWEEAFPNEPPWNAAELAIPTKLAEQAELFFVAVENDNIVGTAMAGYDGHRGWLYKVAVLQRSKGAGVATALMKTAERALTKMGCTKINLQVRATNAEVIKFYQGLGYDVEDRISLGKRVSP